MPDWREEIASRMRAAGLRASEADVVEELSQHLDDRYAELRSKGLSEAAARAGVLEELGSGDVVGRRVRAAKPSDPRAPEPLGARTGTNLFSSLAGDLRLAMRMMVRAPVFTLAAVLVIALGIGANTAIFSLVNAVLLRPLPGVSDPAALANIYTSDFSGPRYGASSYPDYEAIRASGAFADVAMYRPGMFSVGIGDRPLRVVGEIVSGNIFDVLGVRPVLGRSFAQDEGGAPGTAAVTVISYDLWQREFAGSADVIGRALRVNGEALTIIGVAPPAFRGVFRGVRMDMWVPTSAPSAVIRFDPSNRGNRGMLVLGRLADGTTVAAAQARLDVLAAQLHEEYAGTWTDVNNRSRVLTVLPESEARVPPQMRGAAFGMLGLLSAVVIIVLLIACANVANLMLSRATARRPEMGIRFALGATRGRVIRQLLVESALLSVIGGTVGVLLAAWLMRVVSSIDLPAPIPEVTLDIMLDVRVLAFSAIVTILTGMLFGLAPALQASRATASTIRGTEAGGRLRMRLRNTLVVVQVAASIVLLAGASLFLRSLGAARGIDTGIVTENVVLVPYDLATEGYSSESAQQFFEELQQRLSALPGVVSVTTAERVPLTLGWSRRYIVIDGYTPADGEDMEVPFNGVSPGYFEAVGIRPRLGRTFATSDRQGAPEVVIVNEAFVRRFWPGESAVGKRVSLNGADGPWSEVVGVVPDAKYRSLTEEPSPYFYYSSLQRPSMSAIVHVRTARDPETIIAPLRSEIRELSRGMPLPEITTLSEQVGMATLMQRVAGTVLGVMGALALAIAAIGLYGVIAYAVAQRTREFGIRTALGAAGSDVQRMVVAQGLRLAFAGAAIGLALSFALARLVRSMLLVSPFDPVALGGAAFVLLGATAIASWIPARRATRVDPLLALRAD